MKEETQTVSQVIAVWGWHLLAWMFLLKSLGFLVVNHMPMFFGLVGCYTICELIALNKKWKLEANVDSKLNLVEEEDGNTKESA